MINKNIVYNVHNMCLYTTEYSYYTPSLHRKCLRPIWPSIGWHKTAWLHKYYATHMCTGTQHLQRTFLDPSVWMGKRKYVNNPTIRARITQINSQLNKFGTYGNAGEWREWARHICRELLSVWAEQSQKQRKGDERAKVKAIGIDFICRRNGQSILRLTCSRLALRQRFSRIFSNFLHCMPPCWGRLH